MILDNFHELLETINVLLFKKKLIEGNKKKKKKKKKSSNPFAPKKKSKKDKAKDKKKKEKDKLKKAKKKEKKQEKKVKKKEKKTKKAERKAAKTERKKDKHCAEDENSRKCKKAKRKDKKADKKVRKKQKEEIKSRQKLSRRQDKVAVRQDKVTKAKEKLDDIKDRRKEKKISKSDKTATTTLVTHGNDIASLKSDVKDLNSSVNNQSKTIDNTNTTLNLKMNQVKTDAISAGSKAGKDAGFDAGEGAGFDGANDFIKNRFGKYMDEMADDFVKNSATDAGVKATRDYLSSGLYIKCSPVQDSSVDNKKSNILLYDDTNIDSKISKSVDVPDYGTIILIISGMGILIYIISKIYPSMDRSKILVERLPSSLRTVRWLTSIYLLVVSAMCVYITDSLNILSDYAKQVVNIIKKDIKNDRTGKKVDDVDVKEIKQTINKSGLTTILNGLGLNDSDINTFANSINNLIKGDDVSFEIEKRYGFFENDTYEKIMIGAFFAFYTLIACYVYLMYLNWTYISKYALYFLTILLFIFCGIFAVIGMLIYYVWFNVYNKDSINGSANKWKGITSNNDLEKKYVNRLIISSLFITTVVLDPFLKRLIKSYAISKWTINKGIEERRRTTRNNYINQDELNNAELEVNNN